MKPNARRIFSRTRAPRIFPARANPPQPARRRVESGARPECKLTAGLLDGPIPGRNPSERLATDSRTIREPFEFRLGLLGALIDPGADEADLILAQWLAFV